jgi:hypothetical protein
VHTTVLSEGDRNSSAADASGIDDHAGLTTVTVATATGHLALQSRPLSPSRANRTLIPGAIPTPPTRPLGHGANMFA